MNSTKWLPASVAIGAIVLAATQIPGALSTRAAQNETLTAASIALDTPIVPTTNVQAETAFTAREAVAGVSALWGERGEKWTSDSRLPDFSFAGFGNGERALPDVAIVASVKDFGAKGDGVTDDAPAFQKAIAATSKGAISVPAGRYVLRDTLKITRSDIVLRGAGADKTVLVIPRSLSDLQGAKFNEGNKSSYSFSGGFIAVNGKFDGKKLADVTEAAARGTRQLKLSSALKLAPGTFVRLQMSDDNHTLGRHIHADLSDAGVNTYESLKNRTWIDWAARVVTNDGTSITLDRPLRLDVRPNWKPEIWAYEPTVSRVGIENLGFEFGSAAKKAHLKEDGFNAIHFTAIADCWVKNVDFTDADNGVIVSGSRFCTVENTRFRAVQRTGLTGHHALWATGRTQDCLFQNFRFDTRYEHDLTVEGRATGNVFRNGSGEALNFDHHRNAPYENLFTNLEVGDPRRVWQSSGRGDRGPHSGARTTFWNLRAGEKFVAKSFPAAPAWAQINVVGVPVSAPKNAKANADLNASQAWVETSVSPLKTPDLYAAQLERRLRNVQATKR